MKDVEFLNLGPKARISVMLESLKQKIGHGFLRSGARKGRIVRRGAPGVYVGLGVQ